MTRIARVGTLDGPAFVEVAGSHGWLLTAAPWLGGQRTGEQIAIERLLAPVAPSKIVCVGRNYRAHAAELGNEVPAEPLLFMKPPSALLDPGGVIELPPQSRRVEHEVELGVVIGRRVRRADEREAGAAIFGYTIVGDITARDLQKSDGQWTRAKGFDTFCPAGPVIVTDLDVSALAIGCSVSGKTRQEGSTSAMVFSPATLVAYISEVMTLEPGDLIATGTPSGVGPLEPGDTLDMHIEGIGELSVTVK